MTAIILSWVYCMGVGFIVAEYPRAKPDTTSVETSFVTIAWPILLVVVLAMTLWESMAGESK